MTLAISGKSQTSGDALYHGSLIQIAHVSRDITTRAQRTTILDDVTFSVPPHSLFAINGPSGSGKSTLLNMLTGIDCPTSGKVIFAGTELRARRENALARWRLQFRLSRARICSIVSVTVRTSNSSRFAGSTRCTASRRS
jgi:ABC-type cobalamin/Fe3+-siderophores transport system ATPase subunit